MDVPMLDLPAQYRSIRDEVVPALHEVLDGQLCCNGPAVRRLEAEMADFLGCRATLGVSSGTDALLMSLMTEGIGPDDEVIVPTFTFFATAGSVWRTGARPVFVDIDPETYCIDTAAAEAAVTERTRAMVPVDLYGQPADWEELAALGERHGLHVIEDAAQATGAEYRGRQAGTLGAVGCFSFYPTKNLGAMGDAGMLATDEAERSETLAKIRNHGQGKTYVHDFTGGNFRMDDVQAAVLSVKLRHLPDWQAARQAHAARYDEALADLDEVTTPVRREDRTHVYHQYVIRATRRDGLRDHLQAKGVRSAVFYPLCLHLQPCFAEAGGKEGDLPVAEQASREVLGLPVHPELTDEQQDYVIRQIKDFYAG